MKRHGFSAVPLGWSRNQRALPAERERMVQCERCHALADCQTYLGADGSERIGRSGLPVVPRHRKQLAHRGCGGNLVFFDIGETP